MTQTPTDNHAGAEHRPVGVIQPTHERALAAIRAVDAGRLADAEGHIAALPDSPLSCRTWKLLLGGLLLIERGKPGEAEPNLLEAGSLAFMDATGQDHEPDAEGLRLLARILHYLGFIFRRQDRSGDARIAHLAAYRLRRQCGSFEELWETAIELGLDADVARRFDEAQGWYRTAIDAAGESHEEPIRNRAVAWGRLAASLTQSSGHDEAVAAARAARDDWQNYDVAAVTVAQADHKLGHALLKQGEALQEQSDSRAGSVLREAIDRLNAAEEALLAFGPDHAHEARVCLEQKDFADRLLATGVESRMSNGE